MKQRYKNTVLFLTGLFIALAFFGCRSFSQVVEGIPKLDLSPVVSGGKPQGFREAIKKKTLQEEK